MLWAAELSWALAQLISHSTQSYMNNPHNHTKSVCTQTRTSHTNKHVSTVCVSVAHTIKQCVNVKSYWILLSYKIEVKWVVVSTPPKVTPHTKWKSATFIGVRLQIASEHHLKEYTFLPHLHYVNINKIIVSFVCVCVCIRRAYRCRLYNARTEHARLATNKKEHCVACETVTEQQISVRLNFFFLY